MIGNVLNDRYKILSELGKGGMALVYKAQDLLLDRIVAIKMLRPEYVNDIDFVKRFRHEAKAVARISHPNVVNIFDIGQDEGHHYLVMENIQGKNLKDIIKEKGILPIKQALEISKQISSALVVAHDNNIIHCDIKPHNILITPDNQVKVTDFGIARAVTSATMTITDTIVGSAHYFSPEQAKGGEIKTYSDLYSLGIVLYEMLTGNVPFKGDSPISVALKHIQESPKKPSLINSDLPKSVEKLVMKAIAKEPEDRFKDARKMRDSINNVLNSIGSNLELDNYVRSDKGDTKVLKKIDISEDNLKKYKKEDKEYLTYAEKEKYFPNWAKWLIGILSFIIIFTIGGYIIYNTYMDVSVVEVPDIVGMDYEEGQRVAKLVGLDLQVEKEVYHPEIEEGYIISQYPLGGERIRQIRKVVVTISKGSAEITVPELIDLSVRKAEVLIENQKLSIGKKEYIYSDTVAENTIISQTPEPGEEINIEKKIDITISKGPQPDMVKVPNVVGLKQTEAEKLFGNNDLKIGSINEEKTTRFLEGQIVSQDVESGTEIAEGSEIDLTISQGIINKKNSKIFTAEIKNIKIFNNIPQQRIKIVVIDDNGQEVVYNKVHEPEERFTSITINSVGPTIYEVYRNEKLITRGYQDENGIQDNYNM